MTAKARYSWVSAAVCSALALGSPSSSYGQTQINLATQGRNVDFTNAPFTKPIKSGTNLPSQCSANEFFFNTNATPGQNLFACLNGAWTLMAAQTGLPDPGTNGLVRRTSPNTVAAVPAPLGTVVGTTDVQTLSGKSIDASELNSGVLAPSRLPALTGDISTPTGSMATALATVLTSPGTFGDATHAVQLTVDGKGRVTSLNTLPIVTGPLTVYNQQLAQNGTALPQRASLNLSNTFAVTDNSGAARTDISLATVNSSVGTFGSTGQIPVITVNAYGQITAVSTVATPSSTNTSSTSGSTMVAGVLTALPASCAVGNLYFATDQPAGQQIYTCSNANSWAQFMTVGGSGALAFNNGSLDITSVVPRLTAANSFTGSNTFSGYNSFTNGVTLGGGGSQPACGNAVRGLFWFQSNGASKDSLQVCAYSGSTFLWVSLY